MNAIEATLRRMRAWFIVWFVVESAAGLAIATQVIAGLRHHPLIGDALDGVTAGITVASGAAVAVILLALALLVLEALEQRRPWARTVLLVVGWITVVGAVLDLLTVPGSAALFGPAVGIESDGWLALQVATMFTKSVDLVFWSWVLFTLQARQEIRDAFIPTPRMDGSESDGR